MVKLTDIPDIPQQETDGVCGNGIIETAEECDGEVGCSTSCVAERNRYISFIPDDSQGPKAYRV